MVMATFGRAFMLRSFVRPSFVLMRIFSPSVLNQTGVTCGEPSDMIVAKYSKALESSVTRSRNSAGKVICHHRVWKEKCLHLVVEVPNRFDGFMRAADQNLDLYIALKSIKHA